MWMFSGKFQKKIWKNEFNFWILHIKIRLYRTFRENLWKKLLTWFLGHFRQIKTKMKMKMKKCEKLISIFEFSISKSGYVAVFMKIWEKTFDPIFRTFLTNRGKNEDEDEKIWKNEFDFWILHIKIRKNWKNWENVFFRNFNLRRAHQDRGVESVKCS